MRFLLLLSFLIFVFTPAAHASKASDIQAVQNYLQSLDTAKARFVQTTHGGTQLVGTFYLDRPGKLRFQYDPPLEDFVVADGVLIYYYDGDLKSQSNALIGSTLADFFLRSKIDLTDEDLKVTEIKRAGGLMHMTLVQAEEPEAGSLTLGFKENPLSLKKWRVVDAQELITEVELFYLESGLELDSYLFVYADPKPEETQYND